MNIIPFVNFNQQYDDIHKKINRFILDFNLDDHLIHKEETGNNLDTEIKGSKDEPLPHSQAKQKIFDMFYNQRDYIVTTEVKPREKTVNIYDIDVGLREYQIDVLVINFTALYKFFDFIEKLKHGNIETVNNKFVDPEIANLYKYSLENRGTLIFIVELDGDHSKIKDDKRDKFFLTNYAVPTARYEVSDLIPMYKKYRGKYGADPRFMRNYSKEADTVPYLNDLSIDDIKKDALANFYKKYEKINYNESIT